MVEPILTFSGITKRYGSTTVLNDINLQLDAADFMVIYGPPASGKSVLVRLLMGLEAPDTGQIALRGEEITRIPAADRNIGYVPQSFALYPHLSVYDNIAYPLKLTGMERRQREPIVRHAAEMLKIGDLVQKRPDQLSGGQKQRVAIARGIAKRTDLYVLDDPLAGLDFKLREQLVEDLRQLQQESAATFLYTTSDAIEALTLADHLAVLADGRIVESATPERLYREPEWAQTMALVGFPPANFLEGTVADESGTPWCRTALFSFPIETPLPNPGPVTVGIRPEALVIGDPDSQTTTRQSKTARENGAIILNARVILREDLGGEEIVYLDCDGTPLTGVDRHDPHRGEIDEQTTVTIDPRDLILFQPGSGERLSRGATTGNQHTARPIDV
ncbi:MAG: ABC transporter ATP-binding protein [Chloroflexota bacterium]|nr:ABC transporter ATP-binding protein [Chloroflexota bacterium]